MLFPRPTGPFILCTVREVVAPMLVRFPRPMGQVVLCTFGDAHLLIWQKFPRPIGQFIMFTNQELLPVGSTAPFPRPTGQFIMFTVVGSWHEAPMLSVPTSNRTVHHVYLALYWLRFVKVLMFPRPTGPFMMFTHRGVGMFHREPVPTS